jgi:cobalamin-dependent methionine synthase I
MKIIGEKINGTRKRVAKAIAERDADYIQDLAAKQTKAGADWLDVNAGTHPSHEPDDLVWLIENIQSVVDTPLALDSANPDALKIVIQAVDKNPMINSISGEPERLEKILPLVAEHGCEVIALAMDGKRIPETCEKRMEVIERVLDATRACGISDEKVYVDPLAMTVATVNRSAVIACDTIRAVRAKYPEVHFTMGLSNISFGLPARKQINRGFLILAMQAGLDSAILDPLDRELQAAILTTELLLGKDNHCLNYVRASRTGLFD